MRLALVDNAVPVERGQVVQLDPLRLMSDSPIPELEVRYLIAALREAEAFATEGKTAEGLALLDAGLQRVTDQVPDSEPWKVTLRGPGHGGINSHAAQPGSRTTPLGLSVQGTIWLSRGDYRPGRCSMVPEEDQRFFALVYSEAEAEAAQGNRIRGDVWLREGLQRAQETEGPHQAALVELWSSGLRRFQERHPTEWYSE